MCSSSPVRKPKSQLSAEQPSTGECWNLSRKDTPCPQVKKLQQNGRKGTITFKIKPHILQRSLENTNKTWCYQGPPEKGAVTPTRHWARPTCECFRVSCRDKGQQWPATGTGALATPVLTSSVCWHKSFLRRSSLVPLQNHLVGNPQTGEQLYQRSSLTVVKVLGPTADYPTWGSSKGTENPQGIWLWRSAGFDYRTSTGLAKQILGEHKQNLVFPRRQEQWPHVRLSQTCLWVLRSLRRRHGLTLAYCRVRGTCASISPFGRPLGQTRGQTQPHPSTENWIKDLLSMALPIRAKSVFPIAGPSHQEDCTSILINQRADRMKTTITEN